MSYAEQPETNPYVAPQSRLDLDPAASGVDFVGYAGFWRRFAAYLIDYILAFLITIIGAFFIGIVLGFTAAALNRREIIQNYSQAVGIGFAVFVYVVYYAGMESSASQATPGKMAMGVRVTDLEGRRISFRRAFGRLLSKIPSALILSIGFLMAAFTEKKQALHDIMAGTLVVRVR